MTMAEIPGVEANLPRRFRDALQQLLGASLRARFARATLWSTAGSVTAQAGALLATILCARILGTDAFGKLGIVRSTVLLFGTFAGAGLGVAASRYVAECRVSDRERTGRIIGLLLTVALTTSSAVMLVAIGLARPIAVAVASEALAVPLRLAAAMLITNTFLGLQIGIIAGFERFRAVALVSVADGALNVVLPAAGAWQWGLEGAVLGFLIAGFAGCAIRQIVIGRIASQEDVRLQLRGARSELRTLWPVAVPAILIGVAIQPFDWLSRLVLVRRGGTFAELGVFTAAYSLAQFVTFLPMQISGPVMPILSNLLGARDGVRARKLISSSQMLVFAVAAVSGVALIVLSGPALAAYGHGFAHRQRVLVFMSLAYIVSSPTLVSRAVFTATDRLWRQAWQTAVWGVLLLTGTFFLARNGAEGFALAYLAAYAVFTALQLATQRLPNEERTG